MHTELRGATWFVGSLLVGLVIIGGLSTGRAASQKEDVCHLTDDGSFRLITVDASAVPSHLNHGDGVPGGAVPNHPSFTFDDTCALVLQ